MKLVKNLAHLIIVLIACFTLFVVSLYLIFSCTLLKPAFYNNILTDKHAADSIEVAANYMVQNGINTEKQSLKDNLMSLIDGVIRYITQEDMSFSDITIDKGYIESLQSSILAGANDKSQNIPLISRVHPYMMSYFISGSETVYSRLQLIRNSYALFNELYPVWCLTILIIFLLTEKPGKILFKTFESVSFSLFACAISIMLLQTILFNTPGESIVWDLLLIFKPVISKITFKISLYLFAAGLIFTAGSLILRTRPLYAMRNKISGKTSVLLLLFIAVFFSLQRHDITSSTINNVANASQIMNISTLAQNDGAVHSLILKLNEEVTGRPVKDVKLIANKIDYPYNPLYVSALSDSDGNARFILPSGSFLVYADESSLPPGLNPFEPVILRLDIPGNSWYSIYLTSKEKPVTYPAIQSGKPVPYPY